MLTVLTILHEYAKSLFGSLFGSCQYTIADCDQINLKHNFVLGMKTAVNVAGCKKNVQLYTVVVMVSQTLESGLLIQYSVQ